ncbi:unnamed protein product [Camellia sinensis]
MEAAERERERERERESSITYMYMVINPLVQTVGKEEMKNNEEESLWVAKNSS